MKGIHEQSYTAMGTGLCIFLGLLSLTVKGEISTEALLRQQNGSAPSFTLPDGDQLALEVSNNLLPPLPLSEKISREIKFIKFKYRIVSKINHQRKWIPGELISTRITPEQISQVNQSDFGPLVNVQTIDLLPFYIVTILSFNKPYNPVVLSDMLLFHYGFSSSPNTVYYDGDDIFYDPTNSTYIFKQGLQDCTQNSNGSDQYYKIRQQVVVGGLVKGTGPVPSCKESVDKKHFWEFFIADSGNPKLVKEYDIDNDGKKVVNQRYFQGVTVE